MKYKIGFRTWLEGWQEFGFPGADQPNSGSSSTFGRPEPENPIDTFDIEYMRNMLVERSVGSLRPRSRFVNEVTWGDQMGALKLWINPAYGVYIERLGRDLTGNDRWYCKKYFQINRDGYGGYEEVVTQELYDYLQKVHTSPVDSAQPEIENFEGLVLRMSERIKMQMRPIFIFDQIRKINDHRYIISLIVRGQGLQSPGQGQVFRNLTEVNFDAKEGVIRVWNTSAEHKTGRSVSPELTPSHVQMVFFPTQNWDEIADPITTALRFY